MEDPFFERLATSRLVIRRFIASDAERFAAYRREAEVARYQYWDSPFPVSAAREFIAQMDHVVPGRLDAWFQFAVERAPSTALIGDIGLRATQAEGLQAELGFTFAFAHQGQGYAAEAVGALVHYAFGQLAMQRVFSRTDSRNTRARRLLERLGFRPEGEERTWFKGTWATDLFYARLPSE